MLKSKSSLLVVAFLLGAFALGLTPGAKAQVITATPDSVRVPTTTITTDTAKLPPPRNVKEAIGWWKKPAQAAFYSAIVPGLGQAYNRSYWKIPLVYATGAVIGYFIYDNNRKYQGFVEAIKLRTDGDPKTVDAYVEEGYYSVGQPNDQGTINLRRSRDFFRKYRDLDIILGILAWGLNVMEAHVDAHLKAFDVSEDLSFKLQPSLQPMAGTRSYAAGFSLQFKLK
ncbi:hypothetical protein EFA69_18055 [Rufibacter immobilis]|uniref:DUF5683 domain-containing protein n=1 Tax=Rufibacter immobilis TaxID=1348778 RepID=A0A3M9MR53_9BACT|nr:DUF5683 domain-containing protein [Rufibacter immobilis]RNI27990.1 hypothetical protein EFA69_18055 [Rufibacter immobilis]